VDCTPRGGRATGREVADRIEIQLVGDRNLPVEGKTYDGIVSHEILEGMGCRDLPARSETIDSLRAPEAIDVIPSITIPGGPDAA